MATYDRRLAGVPAQAGPDKAEDLECAVVATAGLSARFHLVVSRHNRLRCLVELHAPGIILRNERRMLQEAVSALFDDSEVGALVAHISPRLFVDYFNHIAGTEIEPPVSNRAAVSRAARPVMAELALNPGNGRASPRPCP